MATPIRVLMFMLLVLGVAACGEEGAQPDNERLLNAFEQGRTGIWVSGHGTVAQVIGDERIAGSTNQRMTVAVGDELNLIVRHSLDMSDRVPVEQGDTISFHGLYEWNGRGGIINFTHFDQDQPGQGGWIRHEGTRYD